MKRRCYVLAVVVLLLLSVGVGTATASPPESQEAGQVAGSDQDAGAAAGTAQQEPSNSNTSVRVLSEGDDGDVSQTNEATSDATAGNLSTTEQTADQTQSGDSCSKCGGGGTQLVGQSADNDQDAFALALTSQEGASNTNVPVSVLSEGDTGDVTQTNEASSDATAGNANATEQTADQTQSGDSCSKCGGDGTQLIGQSADNDQEATAISATEQEKPSNTNVSVRVLSPGDNGDVTQTNRASSDATAENVNTTRQAADQEQSGGSCKCKGDGTQLIGQSADSDQDATALAATKQEKPSNKNISVRVLSPGDDGDVTQTNEATSDATAGNLNTTTQTADQTQGGGSGFQGIGQSADNDQSAVAGALTVQKGATNENVSVRVLSPGDGGSVTQSNTASSDATAGNANWTNQTADQTQSGDSCHKCKGDGTQLIGQSADNDQSAAAFSATIQEKPSNTNVPVRILSKGDDGDVTQTNDASSTATAGNLNVTQQTADQTQDGGSGLQVIGQSAKSDQDAFALGLTVQKGAENKNTPVRVLSKGDGGDVTQTNEASSTAIASNANWTTQTADQTQSGDHCKCKGDGLQLIGQSAKNDQEATALAATIQVKPSNTNAPVRILSKGDDGDVTQTNDASSTAFAGNLNVTNQHATQAQEGSGLQVIGQSAKNEQDAFAFGLTLQKGASNENAPVRVLSKGDGGSVTQSNEASSTAFAVNQNWTDQNAAQTQGGPHGGKGCCGTGIQAIGQLAKNDQDAQAFAVTVQQSKKPPCVCKGKGAIGNSNTPTRVKSPGDDGAVEQANVATSTSQAANINVVKQTATEIQAAPCVCRFPIQAVGQLADSEQFAVAGALTLQHGPKNTWAPDRKKSPGHSGGHKDFGKKGAHDASGSWMESDQRAFRGR
jgi:hypothetical protein